MQMGVKYQIPGDKFQWANSKFQIKITTIPIVIGTK